MDLDNQTRLDEGGGVIILRCGGTIYLHIVNQCQCPVGPKTLRKMCEPTHYNLHPKLKWWRSTNNIGAAWAVGQEVVPAYGYIIYIYIYKYSQHLRVPRKQLFFTLHGTWECAKYSHGAWEQFAHTLEKSHFFTTSVCSDDHF